MTSSGMKRGLAVSAISALAMTGLPFMASTASAQPLDQQVGGSDQVALYTAYNSGNDVSVKNDGTDTKVSLVAAGGTTIDHVIFSYSLDGTNFTPITTVATRDANGTFAYDWDASALAGGTITLRAAGYTVAGVTPADTADQAGVEVRGGGATENSVSINSAAKLYTFQQPYGGSNNKNLAIVSGTTSATSGTVTLSTRSGGATGTTDAPVTKTNPGDTTGVFKGVLDVTGYPFGGSSDQIVVGAERDTDDVQGFTIKKQVITTVTASAADASVPAGGTTKVTVTVVDADSKPIAGAQVYDDLTDSLIGYTDANGQVVDNAAAAGAHDYYANATASSPYEPGLGDKKAGTLTIGQYSQNPTSITGTSTDGAVFDKDEYSAGDIYVQAKDQNGKPLMQAGRTVEYTWTITPYDGSAVVTVPTTGKSTATTDANGKAIIPLPSGQKSGTYVLNADLKADSNGNGAIAATDVLTVDAGQASISYTDSNPATAPAGSEKTLTGKLALEDPSKTLPNRDLSLTWARGTESAPGDGVADAGIKQSNGSVALSDTATTDGSGEFTVTIKDPAETHQGSEKGGKLTAATTNTANIGNAGASKVEGVDFTSANSVGNVTLTNDGLVRPDNTGQLAGGVPTPGRPIEYTVHVSDDATGADMANKKVTLNLGGHGMLFDHAGNILTPESLTADSGDYKADADQTDVTTDSNGDATFYYGLERDAGFDDDGMVGTKVTATADAKSASDSETFYSGNEDNPIDPTTGQSLFTNPEPVNGKAISIKLAAGSKQDSTVLPDAAVGQAVRFDLTATDQFDNLVKIEPYSVNDGASPAYVYGGDYTQWANEAPSVIARSDSATDQTLFANWYAPDYGNSSNLVTDQAGPIHWYAVDYAASTFTLKHDTANTVKVGTAVTETLTALDQHGQPIQNLHVSFIRSGPNEQQGDENGSDDTNSAGKATYSFVGDRAGIAKVSAVVRDSDGQVTKLTDSVTFKYAVNALLSLANTKAGNDIARVNAPTASHGATVRLYKVLANGSRKWVATKTANSNGDATFVVADANKRTYTKYQAYVSSTARTFADWTLAHSIR